MPRDIFGGKPRGPSNDDIEREAQRELERLTRAPGPAMGGMGGIGGMGPGMGGPGGPPSLGPKSPLEAMADGLSQRKRTRKKKGGLQSTEDRSEWAQGFAGPASISGSVGSALGFGGGVAPGTTHRSAPPDAKPLKRRTTADDYEDDDDPDDDLFATEIALRDHAERSGKNLEDLVIRSDPAEAEAMRAAAMQRFMQRQPAAGASPSGEFNPPARLNLRRRGRLRQVEDDEVAEPAGDENDSFDDEPQAEELQEIEQELEAEAVQAQQAEAEAGVPQFGLMVDERARLAERRAELAEERATLAEARAQAAELELAIAAELLADYERQLAEAAATNQVVEPAEVEDEEEPPPPRRRPSKAAPKKAAAKKKAAPKKAAATKRQPPAKSAAAPKRTARQRTPPPPRGGEEEVPQIGGALGRRLAQKAATKKR